MNDQQESRSNNNGLQIPGGTILTDTLLKIFNYDRLNRVYSESPEKDPLSLINNLLDLLNLKIEIPPDDLNHIPEEGPFIAVSNHPFRGIDSMILFRLMFTKRKDFKILASSLLHDIPPLKDIIIPVNTYESKYQNHSSYSGVRESVQHLKSGKCFGIFPTAEDSRQWESPRIIIDPDWKPTALKLIKIANVPVIPVYFHGTRNRIAHMMRRMIPLVNTTRLPVELVNRNKRTIKVRIGAPVTLKEQAEIKDLLQYGRYLRARVYSLGSTIETTGGHTEVRKSPGQIEPVIDPVPPETLSEEFERIRGEYVLFSNSNYSVVCAPAGIIPDIFREIGRMREITFREVGEGTNKSIDIDEYDFYYYHLLIWDSDGKRVVGAYRLGKGKEIISTYGIKGFYINSLFGIKKEMTGVLKESIELGRSFIAKDYQKKVMPLFMLWKGIMLFLLKNSEYRYLIGPVSISNDLSSFSKTLIVDFIKRYFFNRELSQFIIPRNEFVVKRDRIVDRNVIIDTSERDINKIEHIIMDIDPGYRIPVLLKKYIEINGKIIGFNIDPAFNNCLDGLLILDLFDVPEDHIKGLSREINDPSIIERFRKQKGDHS